MNRSPVPRLSHGFDAAAETTQRRQPPRAAVERPGQRDGPVSVGVAVDNGPLRAQFGGGIGQKPRLRRERRAIRGSISGLPGIAETGPVEDD